MSLPKSKYWNRWWLGRYSENSGTAATVYDCIYAIFPQWFNLLIYAFLLIFPQILDFTNYTHNTELLSSKLRLCLETSSK